MGQFFAKGCSNFKGVGSNSLLSRSQDQSSVSVAGVLCFIHDEHRQEVQDVRRSYVANAKDYELGKKSLLPTGRFYKDDVLFCAQILHNPHGGRGKMYMMLLHVEQNTTKLSKTCHPYNTMHCSYELM